MFKLIPTLNAYRKLRFGISRPKQSEGTVWNRFYHHLEHLDETHVNDEIKKYYHSVIKAELKAFKANRFVNKNPFLEDGMPFLRLSVDHGTAKDIYGKSIANPLGSFYVLKTALKVNSIINHE